MKSSVVVIASVVLALTLGCYEVHPQSDGTGSKTGTAANGGGRAGAAALEAGRSGGAGNAGNGGTAGSSHAGRGGSGGGSGNGGGAGDEAGNGAAGNSGGGGIGSGGPLVFSTDPGLRVAFFGDQAINANADAVLTLIKNEGADLVIHAGDFAYIEDVPAWEAQIDAILGPDFPYFAAIGNHDVFSWPGENGYQAVLQARLSGIAGATCTGDLGVNSVCRYRGLVFVLSGVGTYGDDTETYLDNALDTVDVWRLCVWHKNQHDMQVGNKSDEVGWRAYQICQAHGAPILTAHEHSYGRTYTLTDVGNKTARHGYTGSPDELTIDIGSTAVFQSGLGGHSYRVWNGDFAPWWATIYAAKRQMENAVRVGSSDTVEYGALFIDFHTDQDPFLARGYFKTVSGKIIDHFELRVPH